MSGKKKYSKSNYRDTLRLGDHLYYNIISQGNTGRTRALVNTTKEALEPYYSFLSEAIKAEEKRGQYEIKWERIHSKVVIRLKPVLQKYHIKKPPPFLSLLIKESSLKDTKNRLIYEQQDEMITFDKADGEIMGNHFIFTPEIFPKNEEAVELNGSNIKYSINQMELTETSLLKTNNKILNIHKIVKLEQGWDITFKTSEQIKAMTYQGKELTVKYYQQALFETLYDGDKLLNYQQMGVDYHLANKPQSKILKTEQDIEYSWYRVNAKNEEYTIQLIDDDHSDSEKQISEYFFDDEVSAIYQGKDQRERIDIKRKKSEEKILVLKKPYRSEIKLDPKKPIKISVNTTNLKRQKEAIRFLNSSPVGNQQQLIKLFERQSSHLWEKPKNINPTDDWFILTDLSYDGTQAQRNFVDKARATKDFAILEGPPGSGKTTAIMELILQLIREGNTILLSASTHVAIDNVLERIKEKDRENLVEPLRIGDSGRIDESVKYFQIDYKIEAYIKKGFSEDLAKQLVLDGANLVCGTTMGIQRHPDIFERDRNSKLPMAPKYDYMIIDESSKTTFQEFLVPALQAKKWILVGDIKQLSPYIEQSHIIHNFNFLVDSYTQTAIRLIFETLYNNPNPYLIEVNKKVMPIVQKYITEWGNKAGDNAYKNKEICYLKSDTIINDFLLFQLLGSDLILLEEGCWQQYKLIIPKTHLIILKNKQEKDPFFFQQLYLNRKRRLPQYQSINRQRLEANNPLEAAQQFSAMLKEKSWAEEIAWRMIRVYERRMLKNPDSYYEKTFELLKPIGKDNVVDRIYNMTLPSILESIQTGNGENHRNNTTITKGFDQRDLSHRHQILDYQHRMHPDISEFSRLHFYTNEGKKALLDGQYTDKTWDFKHYTSRSIWINIPKAKKVLNQDRIHQAEVDRMIKELNIFIQFAKDNPHPTEKNWSVAVITFYRPQEARLREALRQLCNQPTSISRFKKEGIEILNYTVDKFQGMEADIVFLSMVRAKSIGFLDNINRLNVALTRARFQRVILGDIQFFKKQRGSKELQDLAGHCEVIN